MGRAEIADRLSGLEVPVEGQGVYHLVRLAALGVEGAVVGRALYTGHIDLEVAIARTRSASHPS